MNNLPAGRETSGASPQHETGNTASRLEALNEHAASPQLATPAAGFLDRCRIRTHGAVAADPAAAAARCALWRQIDAAPSSSSEGVAVLVGVVPASACSVVAIVAAGRPKAVVAVLAGGVGVVDGVVARVGAPGPYDRIQFTVGTADVPAAVLARLAPGGRRGVPMRSSRLAIGAAR
ncbi:hypothetical protein [Actinomadura sp. NPDC049753]|uniref:hypothetical protein n=1 Tax=Actinomadura sp. NPDC049753 TaxID=3154739 RepID=UPI003430B10C